ncbi:MAG: hypothetical protein LBC74_07925 [Planctomycetaceae bacterium]|nr:hypothetical protein [Planctomycetaceae bacterium]
MPILFGFGDILDLFSNLKIHQRNKKPPLTPPRPPLTPLSEGSVVVSYRLAKRSTVHQAQ